MKFLNKNTALCITALLCSIAMFGMEQTSQQATQKVLFQPKALDSKTQAALEQMRREISAEEDAFWNQSIDAMERQVGIDNTNQE
jgi:hypothetical protein